MKDFTKTLNKLSCNRVGNALKYTNLAEAKKMCKLLNESLAPDAALRHYRHVYEKDGVYYVMETGEAVSKGMKRAGNSKVENAIPQGQVDGPSGSEIREIAGKVYKTGMPKDRLILETCWELAKKYKSFQTNTHTSDMVSEVIEKYKIGNDTLAEYVTSKPRNIGNSKRIDFAKHIVDNSKQEAISQLKK